MTRTRQVDAVLTERIGLDPGTVGASLIARGLQARMSALGVTDRGQYERLLEASGGELQALIEEVVVPESWFFRDERPFSFLADEVRAGWLGRPDRPPLRALSLPCAAGEEPYSIAIALLEAGLPAGRFHVDAVDISERALARARRGVYGRNAFRGRDGALPSRHFREQPDGFELDAAVRAKVRFVQGNLVDPRLLAGERPYDFIFCRNVLIYLTEPARAQASSTLARLLSSAGVLFLGHADRLEFAGERFAPAGEKGSFAHRRNPGPPAATPLCLPAPLPASLLALPPARPRRLPPAPTLPHEGGGSNNQAPPPRGGGLGGGGRPPAASELDTMLDRPGTSGVSPLELASERAGRGEYDEAIALCERSLRESGPSARAFFLLGLIRQAAGDRDQAEASFQKTVYLDAQHDEALLALALIAERRGDGPSAVGYRRRAERALARKGAR